MSRPSALTMFRRRRTRQQCGLCVDPSPVSYCEACIEKIKAGTNPSGTRKRSDVELTKILATVAAEKARLRLLATGREVGAEERAKIEAQMRAEGRLR